MIVVLVLATACAVLAGLVVLLAWAGIVDRGHGVASVGRDWEAELDYTELRWGRYFVQITYGRWCE